MATDAAAASKKRGRPAKSDEAEDIYVKHTEMRPKYLRHYVTGAQFWGFLKGHLEGEEGYVDFETFNSFKSELAQRSGAQVDDAASDFVKTTMEKQTVELDSLTETVEELKAQVELLTRTNTDLVRKTVILESQVEELKAQNTNVQNRLKVVEDLTSAFEVLYPTKSEVKDMFKDSKK